MMTMMTITMMIMEVVREEDVKSMKIKTHYGEKYFTSCSQIISTKKSYLICLIAPDKPLKH